MEESRAYSAEVYHRVIDASPSAILITDLQGRITLVNHAAEVMYGYDARELLGKSLDEELLPERLREYRKTWRQRYRDLPAGRSMPIERMATIALRKDGTEFPVEATVTSIDVDGAPMLLACLEDVTAWRRLEKEARAVSDDLVATVSHELRTPLTSIIGYAEVLADIVDERVTDADLRHELARILHIVERNAVRERRLVEDLLLVAFLDADERRIELAPVDLNEVVRYVVEDHLPAARAAGVTLSVTENTEVAAVIGEPLRLSQLFDNLIGNAVKFTEPAGQVHLSVHHGGRVASVEVADTGCGIAPADLPRLFDRLYRSHSAIDSQKPGVGLGLSIAKRIVDAHDGHISVRSTPGRGTLVQVDLPYAGQG